MTEKWLNLFLWAKIHKSAKSSLPSWLKKLFKINKTWSKNTTKFPKKWMKLSKNKKLSYKNLRKRHKWLLKARKRKRAPFLTQNWSIHPLLLKFLTAKPRLSPFQSQNLYPNRQKKWWLELQEEHFRKNNEKMKIYFSYKIKHEIWKYKM